MAPSSLRADPPDHDQWGVEALEQMVQDLDYPRAGDELRDRIGGWRVPMPGRETVPMDRLLEPLEGKTFRSPKGLVKAIRKEWPSLADPDGPWPGAPED